MSELESVVDRLRARGPSNQSAVRCWYCQRISAWWDCDCLGAREAREGKRPKPRVVFRDGKTIIVLDEETVRANEKLGRKRYRSKAVHAAPVTPEPVHKGAPVDSEVVHAAPEAVHNPDPVDTDEKASARKAYKAEWMRRRRSEKQE